MKIFPDKLAAAVQQGLQPLYLLSGDEVLLINECADHVRHAAHQRGFTEREVFHAEGSHVDWEPFLQSANSMSLFSEKKLIEIRSSKKNLSDEKFLSYWDRPNPDIVVLITLEKVDKKTEATKWFSQLEQAAIHVPIWPMDDAQMLKWLSQRAKNQGLQIKPEALKILQDRTEGNLLAASQELEKLHLLYGTAPINTDQLNEAVVDSARYNVFKVMDAALGGQVTDVVRILRRLHEEGDFPTAILSLVLKDLRILVNTSEAVQQGQSASNLLFKHGVWKNRESLFQQTLKRHNSKTLYSLLQRAHRIDLSVKGMDTLNPQDALENLCLAIAGKKIVA